MARQGTAGYDGSLQPVDGDALRDEMAEKADSIEGSILSPMSPHHFWRGDWGSSLRRRWDVDDTLRVERCYQPEGTPEAACLTICEVPFAPSLCVGTGGVVWPASLALASYVYRERAALHLEAVRTVLEIGAGSGIPGLCAASLLSDSSCRVFLTDENRCILENLRLNADANRAAAVAQLQVAPFVWEDFLQGTTHAPVEDVDLLLGSDVIWGDRGPAVARLALRLLRPGGMLLVSAREGRNGLDAFAHILRGEEDEEKASDPEFAVEMLRVDSLGEQCLIYACRRHPVL
uniref:Calmodulin-lysine N-methyltransferase n=1 Tax=Alexandrium monilatum TaxID=311494 RepID=A0A7S4R7V4_9DINO|mmetsp:Transcript_71612/g.213721  ORF Transcript_71612/g.213721 Transcript_71612/m.213721 type:complete len:290 (+) Transcript_71612:118-987(+)